MAQHTFFCIDAHTCGNPVRVVVDGGPGLEGSSMNERRLHFMAEFDWIRTGLMFEPRGHDMMSGSILYPPTRDDTDIGLLFIETSGCLPMCGHGTIGTVTVLIEHNLVQPRRPGVLRLEVPAGIVEAHYTLSETDSPNTESHDLTQRRTGTERNEQNTTIPHGTAPWQLPVRQASPNIKNVLSVAPTSTVQSVRIVNVPSFLHSSGLMVDSPELGELHVDVAYGGNFYAIVEPQKNYLGLETIRAADILRWSPLLRQRLNEKYTFVHPENSTIEGLSHVQWTGAPKNPEAHGRNAVFYGDKAIDRSPCGTGTSARMAQLAARGALHKGDVFVHESIIGGLFRGRIEETTTVGPFAAIVPSIEGWAKVMGFNTIFINDDDPYKHGFQVL